MSYRSPTKDLLKIYKQLDRIAKKGRDNYLEYYILVDDMIKKGKLAQLEQTIFYHYKPIDLQASQSIAKFKNKSWYLILEGTNSKLQDDKADLLKKNQLYSIGITYYQEIPRTQIRAIDTTGHGAILTPIINNGDLLNIQVEKPGLSYSINTSIQIIGGDGQSTAIPIIRAGKIYQVQITGTGSYHNQDIIKGTIEERAYYGEYIGDKVTPDDYQKAIGNKKAYLTCQVGTQSDTRFDQWDTTQTYDRNVLALYQQAVAYLLS